MQKFGLNVHQNMNADLLINYFFMQGDSGGPIVKVNEEGAWVLEGVVSQGNGCGQKEYPGLYVPLTEHKYLAWIREIAFA